MSARRWSKFWWQDWQRDPALRMCSLAARGAWIEMLCLMADADPVGHLLVNGRSPSPRQLGAVLGCGEKEAAKLLGELADNGVFSRTDDGVIYSRRMVRDKAVSDEASANGKMGGNPRLKRGVNPHPKGEQTAPLIHQEAEAEAEADTSLRSVGADDAPKPKSVRASRLPADWQPDPEQRQYALDHGVDPGREAENFREYWLAKAGQSATKTDWGLTWRSWVRRSAERGPQGYRPGFAPNADDRRRASDDAWANVQIIPGT
ncbi:hypothetical protein [Tanticharoenia sakaeratensis]|uniref:Uncharacterized protein n=1 Tax=Tanticharoenia sakaeratensis NBRC 103193 TaxID=1231623 RepID=A0A0D6MNI6_9PROT|nr:hypothetical protein [Tanticharoenia sakaeratensis]GAN55234.1 hypothetical protein Tasa_041_029 [Tanticharoenia sakaeratensis NBRC 103193]GBQ23314.1 hypothetical protein AA103193_2372 [Tanticharoenia sakaeratensis NBRC 103193]